MVYDVRGSIRRAGKTLCTSSKKGLAETEMIIDMLMGDVSSHWNVMFDSEGVHDILERIAYQVLVFFLCISAFLDHTMGYTKDR